MKKKLIVIFILALIVYLPSTGLAGPYADVPAKHWAYDAVSQLAKDGIVTGYDAGSFRGDRTLTRYEMAIVVGKAIEHADKASQADKALINKLSTEFSKELETLGVRTATLEAKVSNLEKVKINGDFYARFWAFNDSIGGDHFSGNLWRTRFRLNISDQVDDSITAFARFGIRNAFGGGTPFTQSFETGTDTTFQELDQYGIKYTNNGITYKIGRQGLFLGQGLLFSSGDDVQWDNKFDGLVASGKIGAVNTTAFIGETAKAMFTDAYGNNQAKLYGADLKVKVSNNISLGSTFLKHQWASTSTWANPMELPVNAQNMWASNVDISFGPKFTLSSEYAKSNADSDGRAYFIGGTYIMGRDLLNIKYLNVQRNALDPYSSIYSSIGSSVFGGGLNYASSGIVNRNWKGWEYYYYHPMNKATFLDLYVIDAKSPGYSGHDLESWMGLNVRF